jgi:hypothetical protein
MTRIAGQDFADEAPSHPNEHVLELSPASLDQLQKAVHSLGDVPARTVLKDFILTPLPPKP